MSSFRVEIVTLRDILPHGNADRLEVARVWDWSVVVQKGVHKPGDAAIYIPIDSLLPQKLEDHLFPPESKIKLEHHRVRSIKIRQALSQGMIIPLIPSILAFYPALLQKHIGDDVADILEIVHYEPPMNSVPSHMRGNKRKRNHPLLFEYTDIENFKYYPELFQPDEVVYVTEKIHGTSVRYGRLPVHINSLWKRIRAFFHMLPRDEFVLGSRHVQLQKDFKGRTFYDVNVYAIVARQLNVENRLKLGEIIYGEIIGHGIQKGYEYGCSKDEWKLMVYDVKIEGHYLDAPALIAWCIERGFQAVPLLYLGPLSGTDLDILRVGPSLLGGQPIREGIVIRSVPETICYMGRKILKHLNDDYLLLKHQTDFH